MRALSVSEYSASRGGPSSAAERNSAWHEESAAGNCNWSQSRPGWVSIYVHLVHPTREIVVLRPSAKLGLMAEAHTLSKRLTDPEKEKGRGVLQWDDAPGIGTVQMPFRRVACGAGRFNFRVARDSGANPRSLGKAAVAGSLRRVPDASHDFGAHPIESLAPYLSPLHCAESETLDGSPSVLQRPLNERTNAARASPIFSGLSS